MSVRKPRPSLFIFLIILSVVIFGQACKQKKPAKTEYCTAEDFYKMDKIDIHCHIGVERFAFMELAVADNFRILTINTDAAYSVGPVEEQQKAALYQRNAFPDRLAWLTSFSMKGWDDPGWELKALDYIKDSFTKGAIGMKVWKNIGMVEKDKDGKFIMIDDPKFDTIFNYLEKNNIPVCGHLGEPKNCWLPLEEMTVNNDRNYFKEHPQFHMYLHPDFPSYEDQIQARDNLLRKHPDLRFMGAHLASLEWSVDELGNHLEMFPNATVDMAARICHIEKQTREEWQKVHDFFIRYQNRILYGTDQGDWNGSEADPEKLKSTVHEIWTRDWKFLTTDSTMNSWEVDGEFRGLKLPKEVIEKIYFKNAVKLFPTLN